MLPRRVIIPIQTFKTHHGRWPIRIIVSTAYVDNEKTRMPEGYWQELEQRIQAVYRDDGKFIAENDRDSVDYEDAVCEKTSYEECAETFRWLWGDDWEEGLRKP